MDENKLRELNRLIFERGCIDTDALEGLFAERAMHIATTGIGSHWEF